MSTFSKENALFGHTNEETAYVVDDYPYGFKLRTQIRYWIETTKHGDRFVSQTLNPKTNRWNKPKKSTYTHIGCLYLNEDEHVKWIGIGVHSDADAIERFIAVMGEHLSDMQKDRLAEIKAIHRVWKDVTVTVHEGQQTDEEREEQARIARAINRRTAEYANEERAALDKNGET